MIFQNYQYIKLIVPENIEYTNLMIVAEILLFSVLFVRKREKGEFLDRVITDQIKGLAILMVVTGHIWVHVTLNKPLLIMSGDGVTFFLFLSGYGITMSLSVTSGAGTGQFIARRINRVMIPYWVATFFILCIDFLLLDRTYKPLHIVISLMGINLFGIMHHFDYVRWFITFLLFWYSILFISLIFNIQIKSSGAFIVIGIICFLLNYYIFDLGWYQFLAFPMGIMFAENNKRIKDTVEKLGKSLYIALFLIIAMALAFKGFIRPNLPNSIPTVSVMLFSELVSLLLIVSVVLVFHHHHRYYSGFLLFFGKYSYEIFLFHGVFLVKYNPVFGIGSLYWTFPIFLAFIAILSMSMNKGVDELKKILTRSGIFGSR